MTATSALEKNTLNSAGDLLALQKQLRENAAVGLIYDSHVHNCTLYTGTASGRLYGRDALVSHWLSELHGFSEQQLSDTNAFAAPDNSAPKQSQLLTSRAQIQAIHSGENVFGPGAGRQVHYRTQSLCRVANGRILEEWQFTDRLHLALQLDLSPQQLAKKLGQRQDNPLPQWNPGELASAQGQTGPQACELDTDQTSAQLANWPLVANWTDALNFRRFDRFAELYQAKARIHAPGGRQLAGAKEQARFWLSLIAALPDCRLQIQQLVVDSESQQLGLLWRLCGHHTGPGLTPETNGQRLSLQGISQWQLEEGKIGEEWSLFDEIDLIAQSYSHDPQAGNRL